MTTGITTTGLHLSVAKSFFLITVSSVSAKVVRFCQIYVELSSVRARNV